MYRVAWPPKGDRPQVQSGKHPFVDLFPHASTSDSTIPQGHRTLTTQPTTHVYTTIIMSSWATCQTAHLDSLLPSSTILVELFWNKTLLFLASIEYIIMYYLYGNYKHRCIPSIGSTSNLHHIESANYKSILCQLFITSCKFCTNYCCTIFTSRTILGQCRTSEVKYCHHISLNWHRLRIVAT